MHAGAAARISNILTLHRASTSKSCTPVEREHRKRLWWSTFCLDRMTSTQLGVLPSLYLAQTDLDYPSPSPQGMPRHEAVAEFSDADLMTARVDLTAIQDANASQAAQLGREDAAPGDVDAVVRPTLIRLLEWQAKLPAHLALGVGVQLPNSTSLPFVRSFANLHIRYNQVGHGVCI